MEDDGNPFAISNLVHFETNTTFRVTEPWSTFRDDTYLGHKVLEEIGCLELALPDLSDFKYGQLESLEKLESFSASSTEGSNDEEDQVDDDPWLAPHPPTSQQHLGFRSWEIFHDREFKEPRTIYLSEGGPGVFDAALKLHLHGNLLGSKIFHQNDQTVVNSELLIKVRKLCGTRLWSLLKSPKGLAQLGLGRESILFKYDSSKEEFQQVIEGGRMSGYSRESFSRQVST